MSPLSSIVHRDVGRVLHEHMELWADGEEISGILEEIVDVMVFRHQILRIESLTNVEEAGDGTSEVEKPADYQDHSCDWVDDEWPVVLPEEARHPRSCIHTRSGSHHTESTSIRLRLCINLYQTTKA